MSHTPSNPDKPTPSPGKPTPSIYPYTVPPYLPNPTHPPPPPLSPPNPLNATILDINSNPISRTRAPIIRRTASGHLFAAPHDRSYASELPPSSTVHCT
ncbi:hypothetical protein NX059_008635 [Plenodomus lindquistii]|nr:hypothetical protein NX059_008635 [Plenodomus lindquistii]